MLSSYEEQVLREAKRWEKSLSKRDTLIQRSSKRIQTKINKKIPERVHQVVTESIRKMIEAALTSSEYIDPVEIKSDASFREREVMVYERMKRYKRTAAVEGAGTGAGGLLLGMADFPLLLSIKMKFLFDVGQLYGCEVQNYQERMYILHVFMLAFSSDNKQKEVAAIINHWEQEQLKWKEVDWKSLQLEYRDTIDFVKMLQLIPGFGAVVGAWANTKLLEQLGETAMNCYRLRTLRDR
ncbi:EcsC family protein [Thalassobacillus devorans]|uniref:EcsC family protein n=1 Tax=Thalassobacillus devorans TaxID=279813 RepID=UPI000A1CC0B2|nr:EcsC family protein [Thalassobacillus devorans]